MILVYFFVGVLISLVISEVTDYLVYKTLYGVSLLEEGQPVQQAFLEVQRELWIARSIKLLLLVVSAYVLTDYGMRPVKKSSDLQKQFIAVVSHELRTPLAVIKTASEVALRDKKSLGAAEAIEVIESNLEEVEHLTGIINDLLAFSDFENKQRILTLNRVDLLEIANRSVSEIERSGLSRGINLYVVDSSSGFIVGHQGLLGEMTVNLLRNSIAHTPPGGEVVLEVKKRGSGSIDFLVKDSGSGILPGDIGHIFEPFFRGRSVVSSQSHRGGVGLGLYLVREIVELHKGRISVESTPRRGSLFTLSFPPG